MDARVVRAHSHRRSNKRPSRGDELTLIPSQPATHQWLPFGAPSHRHAAVFASSTPQPSSQRAMEPTAETSCDLAQPNFAVLMDLAVVAQFDATGICRDELRS